MKVILNESRFESVFSKWLENEKINTHITYYGSDLSNQDGLVEKGLVRFSQGDNPIGFSNGYIFVYKKKDKELTFIRMSPGITTLGGMFKVFPPEMVEEYFDALEKNELHRIQEDFEKISKNYDWESDEEEDDNSPNIGYNKNNKSSQYDEDEDYDDEEEDPNEDGIGYG